MNPFHLPRGPWFDSILDCLERPEAEESYAPREKWLASVTGRLERHDHRAQLQKGQLVTEHHDAQLLTGKHVMLAYDARLRQPGDIREPCEIAPPYPPCERPIGDLSPILAGDLRLETQHRGRMMLVRVINNPHRGTFITTVVEDEQGTALVLDAYHHPQSVPAKEIMQLNDVLLLKEPFMKTYFDDWRYTLRVDHPGDMVKLTSADERIPAKWRAKVPQMAPSKDLRAQGNKAVQEKKWAEAHRLYTSAIEAAEDPDDKRLAHLNRSLTNLRLGRPERALEDARNGSDAASPSEKGLFRETRALYELGRFEESLQRLETLSASYPENKCAEAEVQRAKARLLEQQTGNYDFGQMYEQARQTPPLIDCATYSAPVEVRPLPGGGHGLFTTRKVSAGELLACEKAFAYAYAGEDKPEPKTIVINITKNRTHDGSHTLLLPQLVHKLHHGSPSTWEAFTELRHGDHAAPAVTELDGVPVVDSFLVAEVMAHTSSRCTRTSRASHSHHWRTATDGDPHKSAGLWLLGARINHSCIGNCQHSYIGDMQITRATRDLEAGTELLAPYARPSAMQSHSEVQKKLSHRDIVCSCALCEARKVTPSDALARRTALWKRLQGAGEVSNAPVLEHLAAQIEKTYAPGPPTALRIELWHAYFLLGMKIDLGDQDPKKVVRVVTRGLEALGFGITATVPRKGKKASLEVTRWGYADVFTTMAFLYLFRSYEKLAPELCAVARRYAGIAYSLQVGEEETMGEVFRELA